MFPVASFQFPEKAEMIRKIRQIRTSDFVNLANQWRRRFLSQGIVVGVVVGTGLSDKSIAAIREGWAAAILADLVISYQFSVFSKMRATGAPT